jgi:hypothetical protein
MFRTIAIVALVLAISQPVAAQWVVYDAAVTTRNSVTATVKELLIALQREQHDRLRRMAARLSAVTDLSKYAPRNPPEWRAATPNGLRASQAYNLALYAGAGATGAYTAVTQAIELAGPALDVLPAPARRAVAAALATVDTADAIAIAASRDLGQLRALGRAEEQQAIDALAAAVVDSSPVQSATAVLEKTAGASIIAARQRQARMRLLTHVVEQLIVDSKRARDTESAAVNMQLATWRSAGAANHALVHGAAQALTTWRQP